MVQALSLWLFVAGAWRIVSSLLLGARHKFELAAQGRDLVLERRYTVFGRTMRTWRSVLPIDSVEEITLQVRGEPASFTAGLSALVLGTFLGGRFLVEGARAPGGAPSLLIVAVVLVLVGIGVDYLWGSGRTAQAREGKPQFVLRARGERGWVLAGFEQKQAEQFLRTIEDALRRRSSFAHASDTSEGAPRAVDSDSADEATSHA